MMSKRDVLAGGLAVVAAGAGVALRPHRRFKLLRSGTIDGGLPREFSRWKSDSSSGVLTPDLVGKLASTIYKEIVSRSYYDQTTGATVMLLAAYGDTQSDLLQLHRPEVCYPAVGFAIKSTVPVSFPIAGSALLPARKVVATMEDHAENIFYWTRLGEDLPQNARQQRTDRFLDAVHGFIADGILMRLSVVGPSEASFAVLDAFVPQFLRSVEPTLRPALIGTRLANAIAA
jgi:EpsI family protein